MAGISHILEVFRRRREAMRQRRVLADESAAALLARVSRRQALDELRRDKASATSDAERRRISEVREAVFRLTRNQVRVDTATRMLYRDEL